MFYVWVIIHCYLILLLIQMKRVKIIDLMFTFVTRIARKLNTDISCLADI